MEHEAMTKDPPPTQIFTFEVKLTGVGMDFSMGVMTDAMRKAVLPHFTNIARDARVECTEIHLDKHVWHESGERHEA